MTKVATENKCEPLQIKVRRLQISAQEHNTPRMYNILKTCLVL